MTEQLVRKRGSLKASLTSFSKFVDAKKAEQSLGDTDVIQLRDRLSHIEIVYNQFSEIQNEIEANIEEAKLDEQYTERSNFDEAYFKITSTAKSILIKCEPRNEDNVSVHSNASTVSGSVNIQNFKQVKLPVISLPTFEGSYENWLEFRETYESLVHENEMLTPIQRYHYLRASLAGDAAQAIKSIEFTAAGYTVAWQTLCDRYNNPTLLVHNHIKSIFSLEEIVKVSSSKIRKLVDDFFKHLRSIEQLEQDIKNWDPLLIYIICSKLDPRTQGEWEKYSVELDVPTLNDLKIFLRRHADLLEKIENRTKLKSGNDDKYLKKEYKHGSKSLVAGTIISCYYCKKDHLIYACDDFKTLPVEKRIEFAKESKLCLNCLRDNHVTRKCKMGPCLKCKSWHNTMLHREQREDNTKQEPARNSEQTAVLSSSRVGQVGARNVLLPTACIGVLDKTGNSHVVRAILDSGSQSCFITSKLCDKLNLEKIKTSLNVSGISNCTSRITNKCEVQINSLCSNFNASITCFILPEITGLTPGFKLDINSLDIPSGLKLADPDFKSPGYIDLLIGAELFWTLLKSNTKALGKYLPILQETELGWVVSGQVGGICAQKSNVSCNLSTNQELLNALSKFWELEECSVVKPLSQDEAECEKIFAETTRRDKDGRFIVTLPLKRRAESLGDSRVQAQKMFCSTEQRLQKNPKLQELYVNFMREYEVLNHMSPIEQKNNELCAEYYMPHHGVLRENSSTTKLRVVFNASFPSSNGLSLNDIQLVGPVLQEDLISIILRFRQHKYVISADCSKMYRQILVEPSQRNLQKIFWRSCSNEELKTYTLNTVTYGQASSSYLAIRCLFELANECAENKPIVANIIRRDFYVDDMLTGAETIEHAQYICHEVCEVLKGGCFELRKWCSNNLEALKGVEKTGIAHEFLDFASNESTKALGLSWAWRDDKLFYNIENVHVDQKCTKRSVLSLTARIYDPLGLLSPVIIIAKILLQTLWSEKLSWDDPLPNSITAQWERFTNELSRLNELSVKRHVICENVKEIELHGFADASEQAYGACLFVRSVDTSGGIHVRLLCAKSKVAPIKTVSIPRLELCAALLLSRLADKVIKSMSIQFDKCVFWSDSSITLAWIRTCPSQLKIFVANRVAEIQALTNTYLWRYVPSYDNPADQVSRGLYPSEILSSTSWWHGPYWLKSPPSEWPMLEYKIDDLPEIKSPPVVVLPVNIDNVFPFERFSKYSRLIRVTAYIIRFKSNCLLSKSLRETGSLTREELANAKKRLIIASQAQSFFKEMEKMQKGLHLNVKDKIFSLTPYLDQDNILRVGGRLKLSEFSTNKKHPILLHANHQFTKLLFEYEHVRLLHVGPQGLLSSIRNEYWPLRGRNLARSTVKKCMRCFRYRPNSIQPIMGDLPRDRVVPSPPFHVTGIDYAGPFFMRRTLKRGRDVKLEKCYISLFVCFTTKALHLELVSSLSTQSFLQALRRFVSRRGKPFKIVSDNGSNFIGADRELKHFLKSSRNAFKSMAADQDITWQFIPPYSPHMGGLWESGVKSVKYHLRRVLANAHLTFEEFTTTLTQIEAILNSRPLGPLSSDPNDLNPITPAHFLIGRPLIAVPDEDLSEVNLNRLSRFQLVQRLCQHFWKRWKQDYISQLQQRQKWKSNKGQLLEGMLVLIKNDQTLPSEWRLGRVKQLHCGADGISRVASIQTSSGIVKRSFPQICPLPTDD